MPANSIKNGKNGTKTETANTDELNAIARCRGWFPRRCAIELVNPDSEEDQQHFSNKKIN